MRALTAALSLLLLAACGVTECPVPPISKVVVVDTSKPDAAEKTIVAKVDETKKEVAKVASRKDISNDELIELVGLKRQLELSILRLRAHPTNANKTKTKKTIGEVERALDQK